MSASSLGVDLTLLGIVLGMLQVYRIVKSDLNRLKYRHNGQFMGYLPQYSDLKLHERIEIVTMPSLHRQIRVAHAERFGHPDRPQIYIANQRRAMTDLTRQVIQRYNQHALRYFGLWRAS